MSEIVEADDEAATLVWLAGLGWSVAFGPVVALDRQKRPHSAFVGEEVVDHEVA